MEGSRGGVASLSCGLLPKNYAKSSPLSFKYCPKASNNISTEAVRRSAIAADREAKRSRYDGTVVALRSNEGRASLKKEARVVVWVGC